jgi:hypothetical protein
VVKDSLSITRKSTPVSQTQRDYVTSPTGCEVGQSGSDRATLGHASETGATLKGLNHPRARWGGDGCNPFRVDDSAGEFPSVAPASKRWADGQT